MPSSQSKKLANVGPNAYRVEKKVIEANPRKLTARWTIDAREETLTSWDLSNDIKEAIERDMLLKVIRHAEDIILDCHEALEDKRFIEWVAFTELCDYDYVEPVRKSFQSLAEICNEISEQDEFTLTMAGMTEWPGLSKQQQASLHAEKLSKAALLQQKQSN